MTYQIRVRFLSNEHPWNGSDTPLKHHQPANDEAAIDWARGMAEGLGRMYAVELYDDERRIEIGEPGDAYDDPR